VGYFIAREKAVKEILQNIDQQTLSNSFVIVRHEKTYEAFLSTRLLRLGTTAPSATPPLCHRLCHKL